MTFTELSAEERADPARFLLGTFFSPTDASQAAGQAYLKRLAARTRDRDLPVSTKTAAAQLQAIREWGAVPSRDRYATLPKIRHPTLVVHGAKDIVPLGNEEVEVQVEHCGLCHSDLSMLTNDWGWSRFPAVFGHEAGGTVVEVARGYTDYPYSTQQRKEVWR
jgi:hypothetical protein